VGRSLLELGEEARHPLELEGREVQAVQAGERADQPIAGRDLQLAAPQRRIAMEQLRHRTPRRHAADEVGGHRPAQWWRKDGESPLQRLEPRRADQRLRLQQPFGELVLRRVGIVVDEDLIDLAVQGREIVVADLDLDAVEPERHHQAALGKRTGLPEPRQAAGLCAGRPQLGLDRQCLEDDAHIDIGQRIGDVLDDRAGQQRQHDRLGQADVRLRDPARQRTQTVRRTDGGRRPCSITHAAPPAASPIRRRR
jgi:hypothetical protein